MIRQETYIAYLRSGNKLTFVNADGEQTNLDVLNQLGKRVIQIVPIRSVSEVVQNLAIVEWEEKNVTKTS